MNPASPFLFWTIAILAGLVVATALVRPMLRARTAALPRDEADLQVYRDQLAEVDRDIARGTLDPLEGETLRTEISRRLLAAAADTEETATGSTPNTPFALATAALVLAASFGLYWTIGSPGIPDQPRAARIAASDAAWAARPSQAEMAEAIAARGATLDPLAALPADQRALLDRLREVLAERPDDLQGHTLLEGFLADYGDFSGAAQAQAEIIRIKGAQATPADHLKLAEYLIFAVNGYVSPEAEDALREVLIRDQSNPGARYFSGLSAVQAGRPDIAYDIWTSLMRAGPQDAPFMADIRARIGDVARAAGRQPPETRGPAQADIAAAADMSDEDRAAMIRGMVDGLSDRLATEGGPAEDWARLIRSLGVLGERGRANTIMKEALEVFADSPSDIDLIRQAGREAEILQ